MQDCKDDPRGRQQGAAVGRACVFDCAHLRICLFFFAYLCVFAFVLFVCILYIYLFACMHHCLYWCPSKGPRGIRNGNRILEPLLRRVPVSTAALLDTLGTPGTPIRHLAAGYSGASTQQGRRNARFTYANAIRYLWWDTVPCIRYLSVHSLVSRAQVHARLHASA